MKGISLPTNMVVVLILAAVVLTIVIAVFKTTGSSAVDTIKLERERTSLCRQYVRSDDDCDMNKIDDFTKSIAKKIKDTCQRIGGYSACSTLSKECIQQCCPVLCMTTTI